MRSESALMVGLGIGLLPLVWVLYYTGDTTWWVMLIAPITLFVVVPIHERAMRDIKRRKENKT